MPRHTGSLCVKSAVSAPPSVRPTLVAVNVVRQLIPHGQVAAELRSIGRDDERACRNERRLLNRLRADLIVTVPAALRSLAAIWARWRT